MDSDTDRIAVTGVLRGMVDQAQKRMGALVVSGVLLFVLAGLQMAGMYAVYDWSMLPDRHVHAFPRIWLAVAASSAACSALLAVSAVSVNAHRLSKLLQMALQLFNGSQEKRTKKDD